jgi:predicted esterase
VSRESLAANLFLLLSCVMVACSRPARPTPDAADGRGGEKAWIAVSEGRLKTEAYSGAQLTANPTLLVILHGDLPDPTPSYQYAFAQVVTQGIEAPLLPQNVRARLAGWKPLVDVVAVGVLRPGYIDNAGDRSDGDMGHAAGDNFTPEVIDAIAHAIDSLKERFAARHVIIVGHSGGAAIAADVLGRHPASADAALLVACGCDPDGGRARMRQIRGSPIWKGPTRSLQPLDLVPKIRHGVVVRLVVGEKDDVALPEPSQRYADALRARGIDADITIVPSLGHNILLTQPALAALADLVKRVKT